LIRLRKQYACLQNDDVTWLRNSDEADVVTFMRADGQDQFVVVINFSNRPIDAKIRDRIPKDFQPVRIDGIPLPPADGLPCFHLNGFEWRIYHRVVAK
jgi:glycosidase